MHSKDMSRAMRRHHVKRLMAKRGTYWGRNPSGLGESALTPRQLGMVVTTPQICSCLGCGNARRWTGERTMQERRWFQRGIDEQMDRGGSFAGQAVPLSFP